MLYNDTAFVKNATTNEASPSPACCSAMMSTATAGRRLMQADITDGSVYLLQSAYYMCLLLVQPHVAAVNVHPLLLSLGM